MMRIQTGTRSWHERRKSAESGRPLSRRQFLAAAASLLPASALLAQKEPTFSSDVKVVDVLATVRNKQGQIVQNLTKDDFILEEDGRPQVIAYFAKETNLPLTLGLLVDTSLSQRRILPQERSASYAFLDQVLREDRDQAFVIHFDREAELLQDLTSSRRKLEAALALLDTPPMRQFRGGGYPGGGGSWPAGRRPAGTVLYDAVLLASDELMRKQTGRKAFIVLSDGVDMGSKVSLTEALEAAQRADTLVYSILFADEQAYYSGYGPRMGGSGGYRRRGSMRRPIPVQHPDGKKILQRLSRETGGGFFEVSKKQPIEQIYTRIEEELRNQYSLGYTPDRTNSAPGFHHIHLTTKQKDLIVQARSGYYTS
jgi:VWFA-related protein